MYFSSLLAFMSLCTQKQFIFFKGYSLNIFPGSQHSWPKPLGNGFLLPSGLGQETGKKPISVYPVWYVVQVWMIYLSCPVHPAENSSTTNILPVATSACIGAKAVTDWGRQKPKRLWRKCLKSSLYCHPLFISFHHLAFDGVHQGSSTACCMCVCVFVCIKS